MDFYFFFIILYFVTSHFIPNGVVRENGAPKALLSVCFTLSIVTTRQSLYKCHAGVSFSFFVIFLLYTSFLQREGLLFIRPDVIIRFIRSLPWRSWLRCMLDIGDWIYFLVGLKYSFNGSFSENVAILSVSKGVLHMVEVPVVFLLGIFC